MRRATGMGAALLLAIAPNLAEAAPSIHLEAPHAYGYMVGDTIRHVLTVDPEPGYRLDEASLPKPGPLNRWLELRRVVVEPGPGARFKLVLDYQTFYVPLTVKALSVPGFALRFSGTAGITSADMPAWPFSMSPVHGLAVLAEGGLDALQPDAPPEAPDTAAPLLRSSGFGLIGLLALAYLGYLHGLLGFGPRGRHFREARQALRRLEDSGNEAARLRAGFAVVHRAFDRTLEEPLFAERLPEFFAGHAGYTGLRGEIEAFFQASYALFFGDGAANDYGLDRLEALCRACLRIERNRPA
jgi:mxaA protein